MEQVTEKNNSMMESLDKMSKSPSFLNFLAMPLIGSVLAKRRNSKDQPQTQSPEPNTLSQRVPKNKDPSFTTISPGTMMMLKVNDSSADVLGKIYNFMRYEHNSYMKNMISDKKFQKKLEAIKIRRNKELIGIFSMKVEPSTERVGEETKTTKKQPATTTPEVVPPKPSGTTTPTPPKTTEAPSVPPKAVEAPSVPPKAVEEIATQTVQRTPKAISGTLKYGFLTAAGLSAVVSAHEGNPNSVYGDYKDNNKLKNKYGERPEEWSKKNLGTEKKLTDFTMSELLEYQKYRNKTKASTGAVGIAGFMPSTLFGKNLDGKNGLFSKSGLSWNDKFSEDNQKLLQAVLNEQDDKILSAGLTKLGINQITPGIKIASNYVGAQGVLWVIEEGQKDPNITVAEALKKHTGRDVTAGGINQDLNTIKAKDFVAIKEEFALNKAKKLGLIDNQNNTSGDAVNNSSKTNRELKNTNKSSPGNITVLNNNTTTVNGSNIYESPKDNKNTSPFIDKQYGQ